MSFFKVFTNLIGIAFKNLWRRKARTILTVIAVTIGTTAVISLVSIATGAQNVFMSQIERTGALTQVTVISSNEIESVDIFGGGIGDTEGEKMTDETVKEIAAFDHVIAVSPQVGIWSLRTIQLKDTEKRYGLDIKAVEPNQAVEFNAVAGRGLTSSDTDGKIFLSNKLAEALNGDDNNFDKFIGKTVTLTLEKGHFTENMEIPKDIIDEYFDKQEELHRQGKGKEASEVPHPLDDIVNTVEAEIVGIGHSCPGDNQSYITIAWGKELMTRKNPGGPKHDDQGNPTGEYETNIWNELEERGYQTIVAKIDDADNVEAVAEKIKSDLERGAITAKDFLDSFLRVFLIIQIALGGIGGIALLVASIGIINTMLMSILERTKEIGLLKAVGATGGMVAWIFTFEAGLIGFLGGLAGVGVGSGIAEVVNRIASSQLADQNFDIEKIISFPLWLILGTLAFSFVLGVTAGLYPAIRASRLNPIDALRAE